MSSLQASESGVQKIKHARRAIGWAIDDDQWLSKASQVIDLNWAEGNIYPYGVSFPTWKRFLKGNPVKSESFKVFCQVLGLNFQEIININGKTSAEPLYIKRIPQEDICFNIIQQPGSLIRLKGSQQMGKTRMLNRVLQRIEQQGDYRVINVDFQLINHFSDLKLFLQAFLANIGRELGLPNQLAQHWDDIFAPNDNTTTYFQSIILSKIDTPLVLVLKNVDIVFEHSHLVNDFCRMLRGWFDEAQSGTKLSKTWQKLRLVIVHSTDIYAALDINSSPLANVGDTIELDEFTVQEIQSLVKQYKLNLSRNEINQLIELFGGHPFLINHTLKNITNQTISLQKILAQATTSSGIYRDHLRYYSQNLDHRPVLKTAWIQVIKANQPVKIDRSVAFQLYSMGIVKFDGDYTIPRCRLYRDYFRAEIDL
jgi:hypothetical protein